MTCSTGRDLSGRTADSTTLSANVVRLLARKPAAFQPGRQVAVDVAGDRYGGEVACDLPGGRCLVRIVGSAIYVWARQCAHPRLAYAARR